MVLTLLVLGRGNLPSESWWEGGFFPLYEDEKSQVLAFLASLAATAQAHNHVSQC